MRTFIAYVLFMASVGTSSAAQGPFTNFVKLDNQMNSKKGIMLWKVLLLCVIIGIILGWVWSHLRIAKISSSWPKGFMVLIAQKN